MNTINIRGEGLYGAIRAPKIGADQGIINKQLIAALKRVNEENRILTKRIGEIEQNRPETLKYLRGEMSNGRTVVDENGEILIQSSEGVINCKSENNKIDLNINDREVINKYLRSKRVEADTFTIYHGTPTAQSLISYLREESDVLAFSVQEAASTPGMGVVVGFQDVKTIKYIHIRGVYVGSTSHSVSVSLYDWSGPQWYSKAGMQSGNLHYTSTYANTCVNYNIFVEDYERYIGSGANLGEVRIYFEHPMAGDPAHYIYLDVVELYQY